jgi:REP element-mobilizing transposase RayT
MTYLITFACYGCHLHGDPEGSVDRAHNLPGSRLVEPDATWVAWARHEMKQSHYLLEEPRRQVVLHSIIERSSNRDWRLLAAHVRTNHVHVLVGAEARPERVMNDLKSYASRRLNELGFDTADRKRWARHRSTRWLWKREDVLAALTYVVDKQGEKMAVYEANL